jgi:glycosyltransferase involved in cell wall biosynthesis
MSAQPRVVFGLPAYERADSLPETLESILSQTYREFAIVIVDDSATEATFHAVTPYLAMDARITFERNPRRLGMVANWRKCFLRARELHPSSEYFAWTSDHDVWHPRWLEALLGTLEQHPQVVVAYPVALRTFKSSRPDVNRLFDTFAVERPLDRLRLCSQHLIAGNVIYGLFRAAVLQRAGVFRPVLMPDRQVLLELALFGQFKQIPELLWYREIKKSFSIGRQRTALFARAAPWYSYVPAHLAHAAVLFWDLALRGRGRPELSRLAGAHCAAVQLWTSLSREVRTPAKDASDAKFGWLRSNSATKYAEQ